jgi:hypothetical protein
MGGGTGRTLNGALDAAVVATEMASDTAPELGAALEGFTVQVDSDGAPAQLKLMG